MRMSDWSSVGCSSVLDDGRYFQLGTDPANDMAALKASWERLGGNNPTSRILLMPSGQETPHSGGQPWPVGSAAYRNMAILLDRASSRDLRGWGEAHQPLPAH